jgi:hydroxypyruvate reductase
VKKHALQIFRAALDAAEPQHAVLRHLRFDGRTLIAGKQRYNLMDSGRVFVIGAGKASAAMASAVERLLGRRIADGLVTVPDGITSRVRRIRLQHAQHPLPDERGVVGAQAIAELARQAQDRDLVICVISGGASALLPAPVPGLTLEQKQNITQALLRGGANIHELNTVRKHLSWIKGGHLAELAAPARVLTLILSDVIGDDLDVIGSGPTVADRSTVADARAVLVKYGVAEPHGLLHETPKTSHAHNLVVGSNRLAIDAAAAKAREQGYKVLVLSTFIEGETRDVAWMHAAIAKEIAAYGRPARLPVCILSGGETTCTVRGTGLGGRNQEFVLATALALADVPRALIFSAGTDGLDGPTDAAGAMAESTIIAQARGEGVSAQAFLANNDSYRFFERFNALIKTGPTGTNVMDVRILLLDRQRR